MPNKFMFFGIFSLGMGVLFIIHGVSMLRGAEQLRQPKTSVGLPLPVANGNRTNFAEPNEEGWWWALMRGENSYMTDLIHVGNLVVGNDPKVMGLMVLDWDYDRLRDGVRWMPLATWMEQRRKNGGKMTLTFTPLLEANPFKAGRAQ